MPKRDKIYFASDLHLGTPDRASSLIREKHFVRWLDMIKEDAQELYLVGDVFDFWFEYHKAVPKGYVRILGKLAELNDSGIPIHYFTGNHDLWQKDYFTTEIGARIYRDPIQRELMGRNFFIGHGDGLGPGDHGYKFLKKVFRNPVMQWMFHRMHPNFGIGLADYFSKLSRKKTGHKDAIDYGEEEFLTIFCRDRLKKEPEIDYFVFGHRHLPKDLELEPGKYYINLGDWISHFTYLCVSETGVELLRFPLSSDAKPSPERSEADR